MVYSNINFSVRISEDEENIDNSDAFYFIKENFFAEKDKMLGFLQCVIDERKTGQIYFDSPNMANFEIIKTISNPMFNLDFYFDEKDCKIKKKLDSISTQNINQIHESLEKQNQNLYSKCVEEFLTFKLSNQISNDFYHESLDRMKEVLENILTIHYNIKLSEKSKLIDILFDNKNQGMKDMVNFIITKIHHNSTGQRIKINKKEYNYLWFELNTIIYLTTKYK